RLIWQGEGRDGLLAFDLDTLKRERLFPIPDANSFDGARGTLFTAEPVGALADGTGLFMYRELGIDGDDVALRSAALYTLRWDAQGKMFTEPLAKDLVSAAAGGDIYGARADGTIVIIGIDGTVRDTGADLDFYGDAWPRLLVSGSHLLHGGAASIDAAGLTRSLPAS
ncbi:MAG TPA: hypothetical protein VL172_20815, partial [Kofleriaceae bacterium]|nr:hypothetical protein [Kofleriaceae bacterium]